MVISPPCVFLHGQITSWGPKCVRLSCSRGTSSEGDDILQVGICYLNWEIRRNATASGQPFLFHCRYSFLSPLLLKSQQLKTETVDSCYWLESIHLYKQD